MVYGIVWFTDYLNVSGLLIGKLFGFLGLHTAVENLILIGQLM